MPDLLLWRIRRTSSTVTCHPPRASAPSMAYDPSEVIDLCTSQESAGDALDAAVAEVKSDGVFILARAHVRFNHSFVQL